MKQRLWGPGGALAHQSTPNTASAPHAPHAWKDQPLWISLSWENESRDQVAASLSTPAWCMLRALVPRDLLRGHFQIEGSAERRVDGSNRVGEGLLCTSPLDPLVL